MKTVVYQSYRTENVPGWITRCLKTVRDWTDRNGFDYAFVDDRMFDYVPDWFREKAAGNILLISDLARLELAREFLGKGYERTIWVDADIVVFDPDRFDIEVSEEYGFCREVWVQKTRWGRRIISKRVNNAVTVFVSGNSMLDFYIHACKSTVANRSGELRPVLIGTEFLTSLHEDLKFPLIESVGLFSPPVTKDIAAGGGAMLDVYIKVFGRPLRAGNLCASMRNKKIYGVHMTDAIYDRAIDNLLETRGNIINDRLTDVS
ncbi:MAG: hypothetical protein QNJ94_01225 [Alphaproteobacteria bacterium]|nr:hypothetical protein [Alphaproteobacteria bacterium]